MAQLEKKAREEMKESKRHWSSGIYLRANNIISIAGLSLYKSSLDVASTAFFPAVLCFGLIVLNLIDLIEFCDIDFSLGLISLEKRVSDSE